MPLRGHVSFLGDLKHNILRNSSMENNFAIPSARQKAESVFVEVNEISMPSSILGCGAWLYGGR